MPSSRKPGVRPSRKELVSDIVQINQEDQMPFVVLSELEEEELKVSPSLVLFSKKHSVICEIAEATPAEEEERLPLSQEKLAALILGFKVRTILASDLARTLRGHFIKFSHKASQL